MGPDPRTYRVKSFLKLGFDLKLAASLADSRDKMGVFIYHDDVRKIMDSCIAKGKSAEEARHIAFGIFSDF